MDIYILLRNIKNYQLSKLMYRETTINNIDPQLCKTIVFDSRKSYEEI